MCRPFYNGDCSWQYYVQKNCPASCGTGSCEGDDLIVVNKPQPPISPPGIGGCIIDCTLGGYYRHPTDCTWFIQCAPYGPQEMPCGPGTRWDQVILTCNHEATTQCITGNYPSKNGETCGNGESVQKPTKTPVTKKPPVEIQTSVSILPQGIGGCIIDCKLGDYHRHPTNCAWFIQCAPYGPQEMPCGPGTRWDQDILTCNHEATTQCITGSYPSKDGETCGDGKPVQKPTKTPVVEKPPVEIHTVAPISPPGIGGCIIDCKLGDYHRHPTNCAWFIQCAPYGPQEMPCGPGTIWDQDILTCNHESITKCITGNYPSKVGGTCGNGQMPTKGPITIATKPSKPINSSKPDTCIKCPDFNGLYPHPSECTKWVHCNNDIPYVKDCPAGLHFNPILLVCDWPKVAGCISVPDNGCDVPKPIIPKCPADQIAGICGNCDCCHKPHPLDCTSYYFCHVSSYSFLYD